MCTTPGAASSLLCCFLPSPDSPQASRNRSPSAQVRLALTISPEMDIPIGVYSKTTRGPVEEAPLEVVQLIWGSIGFGRMSDLCWCMGMHYLQVAAL